MKRLLVIGASILQLPAILKAKEMGLYVATADYNPKAVGIKYADEYFNVSTIDEEGIYQVAKEFKADGIVTLATDMPMRSLAYACTKLGLVGIDYETAIKATDKCEMRNCLLENHVPVPQFYKVSDFSEYIKAVSNIQKNGYRCIVKPADNSGSRGVTLLIGYSDEILKKAFYHAKEYSRTGYILVEEYMSGPEVSVESLSVDGECNVIQITDKLTTGAPFFVEMGHNQPSALSDSIKEEIVKVTIQAVDAIGIKNGASHTEIIITDNGPKIVEIGARLGGDCITTHLVPLSTGVDMVQSIIDICLGIKPDVSIKFNKGSAIRFLPTGSGIIKSIEGIENAKSSKGVTDVEIVKNVGDYMSTVESSLDRFGYVITQGVDTKEAVQNCKNAMKKIKIDLQEKKVLLCLGGFPQMIDIVKAAQEMNVYTIVADNNPESPAKKYADQSYDISTSDIAALINLCYKEKVNGVFTGFEDFNNHIAQKLCKELKLPFYATEKQLNIVTNKDKFKEQCVKFNINVVKQYDSIEKAIEKKEYPYIIKPVDSYGSRGIKVCYNEIELLDGIQNALKASPSKNVIIEKFIDNDYGVELFYTIVNGHIHLTTSADRYVMKKEKNAVPLPVAEVFPSKHHNEIKLQLDDKIRDLFTSLEIKNGLISVQMLFDNGNFYPYEMAYRFTGEQHYQFVKQQCGVDLPKMMIKHALGENITEFDNELLDDKNFIKPTINLAFLLNPGKILKIQGLERLKSQKEVISYIVVHEENDVVENRGDYSRILMRINLIANSYNELNHVVTDIQNNVSVISDAGEEMIIDRFESLESYSC